MAHPQTNFSSNFQGVDPPLEGYWHDDPVPCGSGNVVTDIWPNPAGIPVVVKGFNALTAEDIVDKLDKDGDASNTTSSLTKASGDTSAMTSGGKLSAIFTAISSFFASVASALGGKADKVTSATNGDFAALDSNGNLTDSGKKAEDFAVSSVYNETDPRNLRSFIKCEGSGTPFYRKLATTIGVDDAGNSSVIKLEGCVGAWGAGDTTDFSIVVRTRGSVLFEASVFKRIGSNNAFDKVNFELYEESDGTYSLWLNSSASYTKCAITAFAYGGAYIVYDGTNGTPTGTLVASASQNYKVMMVTDGDGSNVSVTPDGTSTGTDIGSSTTLKVWAQKFKNLVSALKALAFKDKASYNDMSSGVQSSLDKADSALQSHQSVTDNNPTLSWNTTSKVGKIGSTDLRVTMPANPAQNLPASVITSGTFGTDRIADDAITADKVKDNETLPVNISGSSQSVRQFIINKGAQTTNVWAKVATATVNAWNGYAITLAAGFDGYANANSYAAEIIVGYQVGNNGAYANHQFYIYRRKYSDASTLDAKLVRNDNMLELWVKDGITDTSLYLVPVYYKGVSPNYADSDDRSKQLTDSAFADYIADKTKYDASVRTVVFIPGMSQVGSSTTPVYVDSDGWVKPCTQGSTLKSNTATLYIAGTFGEGNIPYYHVKDIKNGCVNYVHVKDIPYNTCNITIEAPALASGEEYDYVVVFDTFTNSNLIGSIDVENCKTAGHMDNGVFVVDSMALSSANPRYVQMIVVTGNVASSKWYDRT